MKNAIRILLYLLLALLVVAIAVIIYKRSKAPVDDVPTTAEMADSLFRDQSQTNQTALNSEDSMILDLTGQLPSQVGAPAATDIKSANSVKQNESKQALEKLTESKPPAGDINQSNKITNVDYSQPIGPTEPTAAVNTSPKAQKVSDHTAVTKHAAMPVVKPPVIKTEAKKTETKSIVKSGSKEHSNKATAVKSTSASNSGNFYVVSGSFIVPGHADEQVNKLKKLGYKKASRKVFGSSEYYCAVAGTYSNRKEAEQVVNKLKSKGEKAFLKAK